MSVISEQTKREVLAQVREEQRLIGDVADEYGIARKQIFAWLKKADRIDKRTKSIKESKLKSKLAQLNQELEALQATPLS